MRFPMLGAVALLAVAAALSASLAQASIPYYQDGSSCPAFKVPNNPLSSKSAKIVLVHGLLVRLAARSSPGQQATDSFQQGFGPTELLGVNYWGFSAPFLYRKFPPTS